MTVALLALAAMTILALGTATGTLLRVNHLVAELARLVAQVQALEREAVLDRAALVRAVARVEAAVEVAQAVAEAHREAEARRQATTTTATATIPATPTAATPARGKATTARDKAKGERTNE